MRVQRLRSGLLAAWLLLLAAPCRGGCPAPSEVLAKLRGLDLAQGSRTVLFAAPTPTDLYRKAAANEGEPVAERRGQEGIGVILAGLPVASLWKAVSDENHHQEYLPVESSEVLDGDPGGESRLLFQNFQEMGIGRWWVTLVEVNRELYERSGGALWETRWKAAQERADPSRPPVSTVGSELKPIRETRGAWLLVPLAEDCTLVEYYTSSEIGGLMGVGQKLLARRTIHRVLEGVVRMAAEHVTLDHPDIRFIRPDGTPLE